jgi:hypothetical protein
MGRRRTAGTAGGSGVGGFNIDNTTLTAADDLDITIDPAGTGIFKVAGDAQLQAQGDLRFADADSSNWVAFQAPSTVSSNVTWTLPAADGTAGQALVTNSTGTLSWATNSISLTDNTTDAATHFVTLTTATSDTTITAVRRSSSKLTFQPSSGTMSLLGNTTSTNSTSGTLIVTGGVGISENLNVGGSFSASSIAGVSGYVAITGGASLTDIDRKYIVSNTAGITLTLPATSTDGRTITIVDGNSFSSFNVTLGRNTKTIDGLSEDLVLNVAKSKVELVYRGGDWKVFIV